MRRALQAGVVKLLMNPVAGKLLSEYRLYIDVRICWNVYIRGSSWVCRGAYPLPLHRLYLSLARELILWLRVILFIWSFGPLETLEISFVEAIGVGATLSATDPVTILAIFNTYKVDPKLYTVIFGESILNDAVAIVMFETAQRFHGENKGPASIGSLFKGIGIFFLVFTVSLLIGVFIGIGTALLLKHTYIRRFPKIESSLILLVAYTSYLFSNGCHMSGKAFFE